MAAAYAYAEGSGPMPREYELGQHLEAFGVQAVLGRVMGAGELRRIAAVRNVVEAYRSRARYRDGGGNENWAEWASHNHQAAEVLNMAARAMEELDGE